VTLTEVLRHGIQP
jgi:hypothetical protein